MACPVLRKDYCLYVGCHTVIQKLQWRHKGSQSQQCLLQEHNTKYSNCIKSVLVHCTPGRHNQLTNIHQATSLKGYHY